jgi:hypothetical protein
VRTRLLALTDAAPSAPEPARDNSAVALEPTSLLSIQPPSAAFAPASAAFAPSVPAEPPAPLELEPEWQRQRSERVAAAVAAEAKPARGRRVVPAIVALVVVAAVVAVIALVFGRAPGPTTVVLSITAHSPVAIAVDGRAAGTTPVQIPLPRGDHPVAITATIGGHAVVREVVPDRDRIVLLE